MKCITNSYDESLTIYQLIQKTKKMLNVTSLGCRVIFNKKLLGQQLGQAYHPYFADENSAQEPS